MIKQKLILILITVPLFTMGQLTVINPGLEGDPGQGSTPEPWQNCMSFGFYWDIYDGEYATPDTQPDFINPIYEIVLPASEGSTYIGFGHITPYDGPNGLDEFQEGFSQELSSPMVADGCPYIFTIDLANGLTPDPWNTTGIEETIGEVKIYGGFDFCSEQELLWSSGPITNEDWETYTVEFIPSDNYSHILFECFKYEKDAACGYVLADNITPIINTPPASNAGANQEICENFTILNASELEEGETGIWSIISGNGEIEDINNPNTLISNLNIGSNILQWSVSDLCSDDPGNSQMLINVIEEPLANAGIDQEICENFTILNANELEEGETGIWSIISGDGEIENINSPNTVVSNLSEGENIFQWTLSSKLCNPVTDQVNIVYVISDLNAYAGENQEICEPETILNANTPNNNESGLWTIVSGSGTFENETASNTNITNLQIGENVFEWTILDPCESVSSQVTITLQTIDVVINEISNYNGYNILCNGDNTASISLSTTGGYPPYTYNWEGSNGFLSNQPNSLDSLSSGLYQCNVVDSNGCSKLIEFNISEPEPLDIELVNATDLDCDNDAQINLNASGGTGALTAIINTSWGENIPFTWDPEEDWYLEYNNFMQWDGVINVTAIDENGCTISSGNISIQSWEDPIANFSMSTNDTGLLEMIDFTNSSISEVGINTLAWDFGDGHTTNDINPVHFYEYPGQYTICLTIEDLNGCQSQKCKIINIYNSIYVYIPNIFTINNDNINDVFLPRINGIKRDSYQMLIYDRWGKLIFTTQNQKEGWDGTHNGNIVNSDIYSYKISYLTPSNEESTHIGKITLVK